MKLNKKRISILVSLMCLLVLLFFTLCSFDLPSYDSTRDDALTFNGISFLDFQSIYNIVDKQFLTGQLNSFEPIALVFTDNRVALYCRALNNTSFPQFTGSNPETLYFRNSYFRSYLTSDGFTFWQSISNITVVASSCISFRVSSSDSLSISNPDFVFINGTVVQDSISSVESYFNTFYDRLVSYDSVYESGYYDGLESGLIWGEDLGYQEGYTEGYQEGIGTGYRDGFLAGEAEGYDTGYADGYQDGYETGYDSGYAEAERETVIEYVEPFEIDIGRVISGISSVPDNIMNGSFDFELFGINVYGLLKLLIILFVVSAIVVFIIKRAS